ncbi:MAG: hypothetical protein Q8942_05940 [Bacillota bacterium]|nr:hypothetical protein [Bacillota bacterium]
MNTKAKILEEVIFSTFHDNHKRIGLMSEIAMTGIMIVAASIYNAVAVIKIRTNKILNSSASKVFLYIWGLERYRYAPFFRYLCAFLLINVLSFFSSSNHFIITLEIIFIFSLIILVLFEKMKLQLSLRNILLIPYRY